MSGRWITFTRTQKYDLDFDTWYEQEKSNFKTKEAALKVWAEICDHCGGKEQELDEDEDYLEFEDVENVLNEIQDELDDKAPKCSKEDCGMDAAKNEHYPNSEGGRFWELCDYHYEEDQEQYNEECGSCETVLGKDVHIECLEKKTGEEMDVCRTCWDDRKKELKAEGWARNTEEYEPSDDEE